MPISQGVGQDVLGNELTKDAVGAALTSGAVAVSTTAVAARVSASNLTNRRMLTICPTNGTVYFGATSAVTTSTGIPILPNVIITFAITDAVTPFLIAASSTNVIIMEGE